MYAHVSEFPAKQYPAVPGAKGAAETSYDAAAAMEPAARTLRYAALRRLASRSLTADELAAEMGESILTIRPRMSELRTLGMIVDTGDRRLNSSGRRAVVWRVREV